MTNMKNFICKLKNLFVKEKKSEDQQNSTDPDSITDTPLDQSDAKPKTVKGSVLISKYINTIISFGIGSFVLDYVGKDVFPTWCYIFAVLFLGFSIAAVVSIIISLRRSESKPVINRYALCFFLAVNSFYVPEFAMDAPPVKITADFFLLGILLCYLVHFVGFVLFPKGKVWNIVATAFFDLYAAMQYYIYEFRGDPIKFSDLSNTVSALDIKSQYSFDLNPVVVFCLVDFVFITTLLLVSEPSKLSKKQRAFSAGGLIIGMAAMYIIGGYSFDSGVKNRYITLNFSGEENLYTYRLVGFDLMLYFDGVYNSVSEPEDYSDKKAKEILSEYTTDNNEDDSVSTNEKPVIIGIMNESFADFEHIAQFDTNKDYMPNYHKLQQESISGYVTVSAYGGYSCNSEYEFLSGNSLNFLPSGTAVFTQYLNDSRESTVSYLKSMGYYTEAVTPCSTTLWNIGEAYENLGFDKSIFDCLSYESDPEFVNYNYSDKTLFKKVEKVYEDSPKDKPFFMWVTTMQNHGPYTGLENPATGITLNDIDCEEAETFLSSIYKSDEAIGELVDYFRNVDREVIIVMFGDHYPHIMDFTTKLYGSSVSTLSVEDYSRLHQTPFFIWSNKGVSPETIEDISLNYLSNEVLKAADIPLSPYQQALEDIRKDIPIISGFGYKTADGEWHGATDKSAYDDTKNKYHILEYYRMFGKAS